MTHGCGHGRALVLAGLFMFACTGQAAESMDLTAIPEIVVIGVTPVPGLNIDVDKVPGNLQSLLSQEMRQNGPSSLSNALDSRLSSISLNDTLADPFQADILFRGFEASPVLGTPQGMAVYQNGVRINEAFGDTVNWDLIPDIAIQRIDIMSSTPVYGLNALGGAMSLTMKNAFNYEGIGGELSGGSFSQKTGEIEFGFKHGIVGVYGAARFLNQGGWRNFAQDHLKQYYLDLSLHPDDLHLDLSYARANNRLAGQGAAPFQSLAVDRHNVFTGPQANINNVDFFTLSAGYSFMAGLGVQAVGYYRNYRQTVSNGDNSDYTACTDPDNAGLLCDPEGAEPLIDTTGAQIPDLTNGGDTLIGQNDYETIHSRGWGGSLQFTSNLKVAGHGNAFAAGVSVDTSTTAFFSGVELGLLDPLLTVLPSPYLVSTPEGEDGATPVSLSATNKYYGFYFTDTFDILDPLSLTVAARYNVAKVDLGDRLGTLLNGNNRYTHFNPSAGLTYRLSKAVTVYGSYAINNRAPTASEIECSDPERPCLLPSSLAADPPNLKQVVAHTAEIGLRGKVPVGRDTRLAYNLSGYRTDLDDDIYGVSTSVSQGYFQNIDATRRQGIEAGISLQNPRWSAYAQYSLVQATFRTEFLINSPANPFQDVDGNVQVTNGNYLPLIPRHRFKAGGDLQVLPNWTVGGNVNVVGNQFYRGDESNLNGTLPGFAVVSLRTSYRVNRQFEVFANVQNLFDRQYASYGLYGDPTGVGALGVPAVADTNDQGVDNRFQSPGMPRAWFAGIRVSFGAL